jgi:GNAT superfamily N-acetyltransferase
VNAPPPAPITRLGVDDAGELLTLQRAAYVTEAQAHDDPGLPPLRQTLAELRAELASADVTALGVRDRGRLVATVRLRHHPADRHTAEVARLAVAPDRQGEGLGTRLLAEVERHGGPR